MSSHKSELHFSWSVIQCFIWCWLLRLQESWQKSVALHEVRFSVLSFPLCAWGYIRCKINDNSVALSFWGVGNLTTVTPTTAGDEKWSRPGIQLESPFYSSSDCPVGWLLLHPYPEQVTWGQGCKLCRRLYCWAVCAIPCQLQAVKFIN